MPPDTDYKSADYNEARKKLVDWIETNENRLNSACHCNFQQQPSQQLQASQQHQPLQNHQQTNGHSTNPTTNIAPTTTNNISTTTITTPNPSNHHPQTWKHVILYHQNLQSEVEEYGKQLNCELKRHINEDKSLNKTHTDDSSELEGRWHKLWLKSLEQLVVVERTRRCPKHNSTIIGKSSSSPANKSVARPQRRRPISYPNNFNERLEWDYNQQTLSLTGCHKENGSQIDLDSVDEQVTKNLTEFGEEYEEWFGKEDEIACVPVHSRPPSVEPAEQPEIAKAVVISNSNSSEDVNCNLLMLTTPSSMFSVDASPSPRIQKRSSLLCRLVGPVLIAFALLIFSALFQEPHHMHMSYHHSQPPV